MTDELIFDAQLPPKDGYVEVERDGVRTYQRVMSEEAYALEILFGGDIDESVTDRANRYVEALKSQLKVQNAAMELMVPKQFASDIKSTEGDYSEARQVVSDYSTVSGFLKVKDWEDQMTVHPADLVYDPEQVYAYAYVGISSVTLASEDAPGTVGADYWAIVPKTKDGIKIFPDVEGAVVAVKNGEEWYDVNGEHVYAWTGEDTSFCSDAPFSNETESAEDAIVNGPRKARGVPTPWTFVR